MYKIAPRSLALEQCNVYGLRAVLFCAKERGTKRPQKIGGSAAASQISQTKTKTNTLPQTNIQFAP